MWRYVVFCIAICLVGAVALTPEDVCKQQLDALNQGDKALDDYDVQLAADRAAVQLGLDAAAALSACQAAAAAAAADAKVQQQLQRRRLLQDDDDYDEDEPWDAGINSVQPRLSINAISNRDDDDMYKIMYLMAMERFMYKGKTSGKWSYHGIAAVHGLNWEYNGQTPKGEAGHRPYMRLYELGLQRACYKVANRFEDEEQRLAGNRTCKVLRAPWWDVVKGVTPDLLTQKTVTVYNKAGTELVERKNPFRRFCFKMDVRSKTEGRKYQGDCVARSKKWAAAMRNLADNTAVGLRSFYKSPWACSNTWQGNGCSGNLEGVHNTWHQAVGGDVVWLAWAGFDPLFWLFHMAMDRYLYLWQIAGNGNEYMGSDNYKPFPKSAHCGGNLASCGVSYGSRKTGAKSRAKINALKNTARMSDEQVAVELFGRVDDSSGADPGSAQALAYLAAELADMPADTDTFEWNAVFNRLDPYALQNRTYSLHVLLKQQGAPLTELPLEENGAIDTVSLQLNPRWCGSYGSFVTWMGDMPDLVRKNRTVPVPLTPCLRRNGIATDIAPRDPADPTQGPVGAPIKKHQLQVLCVDGQGKDCTQLVRHAYTLGLGWQANTDSYNPSAQMYTSSVLEDTQGVAMVTVAAEPETDTRARLRALGLTQPDRGTVPVLPYLFAQQLADA